MQQFTLTGPDGIARRATVGLPGRYNVTNAALAVALCARWVPTSTHDPRYRRCRGARPVERVERGQDFLAVVDYAHKPAALEAVIGTLRAATEDESPSSSVPAATATGRSGRSWARSRRGPPIWWS